MITPILAASRDAWNVKLSFDRYIGRSKGH
jgi:hypothetical protein